MLHNRPFFTLEEIAYNLFNPDEYAGPEENPSAVIHFMEKERSSLSGNQLIRGALWSYRSALPIREICTELEAEMDYQIRRGDFAGRLFCNALYFAASHCVAELVPQASTLMLHAPYTNRHASQHRRITGKWAPYTPFDHQVEVAKGVLASAIKKAS
jgi:pyrrolidone-carboxylate peptidase